MKLRDALDSIVPDPSAAQVYGQPYQTPDGATVLPVAKVRGRTGPWAAGSGSAAQRETRRGVRHQEWRGHLGARGGSDPDRSDG